MPDVVSNMETAMEEDGDPESEMFVALSFVVGCAKDAVHLREARAAHEAESGSEGEGPKKKQAASKKTKDQPQGQPKEGKGKGNGKGKAGKDKGKGKATTPPNPTAALEAAAGVARKKQPAPFYASKKMKDGGFQKLISWGAFKKDAGGHSICPVKGKKVGAAKAAGDCTNSLARPSWPTAGGEQAQLAKAEAWWRAWWCYWFTNGPLPADGTATRLGVDQPTKRVEEWLRSDGGLREGS
jgi:hypothetical protein